ncbi:hypothetical protein [Asticcacaulis sp. W401b]|uniref:hypothetical protein n=1 Tax=Asticcacaulis sp. W401b TaxID=3388666 RepID=UPI003970F651
MRNLVSFSLMNDFIGYGDHEGKLHKGVISSVVHYATFHDLADIVRWMADEGRVHKGVEPYGIVPSRFVPCRAEQKKFAGMRYARKATYEKDELSFFYIDIDNSKPSVKVNMDLALAKIEAAGLSYVAYTTRSHTQECHRFRVLFPVDRVICRAEAVKIAVAMNAKWISGQADLSVYDGADFIYLPLPKADVRCRLDGEALDTASLVQDGEALIAQCPLRQIGVTKAGSQKERKRVAKDVATLAVRPSVDDHSIRPEIGVHNPDVFCPAWLELYLNSDSHWETMRAILGKVWKRTDGTLTFGETRKIFGDIDAAEGDYFLKKYGEDSVQELIRWYFTLPPSGANDNWQPILSEEDIGLTIDVMEAECGAGKTYVTVGDMAASWDNYVFAAPKISDLRAIREQIGAVYGVRPQIIAIHSEAGDDRVPSQLTQWRRQLDRRTDKKPVVVLTTHAALMMHNWRDWSDFRLVIDEVPEVFMTQTINIKNNPDVLARHVRVSKMTDGRCHRVAMRKAGREALASHDFDDSQSINKEVLGYLSSRNLKTWVAAEDWAKRDKQAITFFSMITPEKLIGFKSVRMLGDEVTKSITLRAWAAKWGVKVKKLNPPARHRKVATGDRVTIRYFAESGDASLSLFGDKQPDLLHKMSDFIEAEHPGEDVLWTANERFRADAEIKGGTYLTPRTHGRNDLQRHTVLAWLAAMKPSTATGAAVQGVCGMTYDDVVEWREYNCMYQFAMRGNLRDPDSALPVSIYVYSRKQADYLHRRLGGKVEHVGDRSGLPVATKASLSSSQRKQVQTWSDKMVAHGWQNWAEVPASKTKSKVAVELVANIERAVARKLKDG